MTPIQLNNFNNNYLPELVNKLDDIVIEPEAPSEVI